MKTNLTYSRISQYDCGISPYIPFIKNEVEAIIKETPSLTKKKIIIFNMNEFEYETLNEYNITIMISGENIYYRSKKYSILVRAVVKLFSLFGFSREMLLSKFPSKKFLQHPEATNYVENTTRSTATKKSYAVIPNKVDHPNILKFPFLFASHFDRFDEFVRVKQENSYITQKKKFCAFVVGNAKAYERIKFFKLLSKYKKVDSFGTICKNAEVSEKLIEKHKLKDIPMQGRVSTYTDFYRLNSELYREYKFVICFENSFEKDYVTEKIANVMLANSIGIYRGCPNINEFFNTKSFINFEDYGSYEKMIEKIIELDQDDTKYREFLTQPFFINNEIPTRIKNIKPNLKTFLRKALQEEYSK